MTITLIKRASASITLAEGVVLTVKPADAAVWELAANIAAGDAALIRAGKASADTYLLDAEQFAGDALPIETMTIIALGRLTITGWTGIELQPGEPAAPDAANIATLFKEFAAPGLSYGQLFLLKMRNLKTLGADAKNASTASPATSTAAAGTTAGSASQPETPAQPAG